MAGDIVRGQYVDPDACRETVGAYAERWKAAQVWRQSTRDRMEHIVETRVVPRFGSAPLQSVRRSEVQGWVADISDELIRKSPCTGITLPKRTGNGALVPLSVEQVQALAAAMPEAYGAIVLVQAGLGLRQGEACGLTVDRVDFLRRTVTIDRQLITPKVGDVVLGPVKTEASNRTIPLPRSVREVLSAHLAAHPPGDDGIIFTSMTGAPLRRSVYGATFRRAAEIVVVDASSHDLRHHCASLLIRSALSVQAVQSYLGHATAAETSDTYGHLWPDNDQRIRAAVDAAFDPIADYSRTEAV